MAGQQYQVVFRGKIVPDMRIEDVKDNLAKVFKTDNARIERLFSGKAMVLKKGLGREEGERYCVLLGKAGALCDVVPQSVTRPPSPLPGKDSQERPGALPAPDEPEKDNGPQEEPHLTRRAAPTEEKTKADPEGNLHQTLGAIREKVQSIDTEAAGKTASSLLGGATAFFKADPQKGGLAALKKNKIVWAGVALCIVVPLVLMLGSSAKPMPIENKVFSTFAEQYNRELRNLDAGSAGTTELVGLAHEVTEDMGFDFDRTLLLWLFRKDLVEGQGGLPVYTTILVEPVAVAVAADLSGIGELLAPETHQIFKVSAEIPAGVDLPPIKMVKACPVDGHRLKHEDLFRILKKDGVSVDASQPDLAIADAFLGLDRAGLIKIHRRWENEEQYSDIEILDLDAMNAVEAKLEYLAEMKQKYTGP